MEIVEYLEAHGVNVVGVKWAMKLPILSTAKSCI